MCVWNSEKWQQCGELQMHKFRKTHLNPSKEIIQ